MEVGNEVRGRRLWLAASLCATCALALACIGRIEKTKRMRKAGALALGLLTVGMAAVSASAQTRQPSKQQIAAIAAMPLTFEKNMGQVDKRADYLSRMSNYTLFLTGSDSVLVHRGKEKNTASALKLRWLGASNTVTPQGDAELRSKSNYLLGSDRANWHSNIPNYQRVREESLYPGIDLVYYGNHEQLEYDLTLAPGADPAAIRLAIDGAKSLSIDKASGDLVILDQVGSELRFRKPVVYQQDGGQKASVTGNYILSANHTVTFALGAYDRAKPLVIDPFVLYSTLFGATTEPSSGLPYLDQFGGLAVDGDGFVYLLDMTSTPGLPTTTGAYQTTCDIYDPGTHPPHYDSCSNFFVAKFDPTQSGAASLVYATYIGGSSFQETAFAVGLPSAHALAVDADGDVYFTGHVTSSDYPTTLNAYTSYTQACAVSKKATIGHCDAGGVVVTKLDPTGATLLYSTYFANIWNYTYSEYVQSAGIAVDGNQVAYIFGIAPGGLPTTDGSLFVQANVEGYFVAAFNTTATAATGSTSLVYAEYFPMIIYGMAADPSGNLYLAGGYTGPFPTNWSTTAQTITINGFQAAPSDPTGAAPYAGELVKLNNAGMNTYATVVGASGTLSSVSVDANGIAYTGGEIGGGPNIYKIDTTQTGTNSLLYSKLVASDFGGTIDDVSDNGAGLVAFTGVGYASADYHLVNALTQPTSVPSTYYDPFAGIIDTESGTTTFLSFLDGVEEDLPIDVILRSDPNGILPDFLYVGGSAWPPYHTFLSVSGSYQTSGESIEGNLPFFYQIAMGLLKQSISFPPPASPVTYGVAPITLSATGGASGNPVIFSIVSGPGSLSGTNSSTLTITGVGTVVIAANQAAGGNYGAATQVERSIVVNPITSTTTVTSSLNPSPVGQTVTFTATVTPSTATGTVQFSLDGVNQGTAPTVTTGSTTYSVIFLSAASHKIAAAFAPAAGSGYATSSGSMTETITPLTPTVTVTPASLNITNTQALSVTVAVSGGAGTPTGSVILSGGGYTSASTPLTAGSATINIPAGALAIGSDTLSASYTPDTAGSGHYGAAAGLSPSVSVSVASSATLQTPTPGSTLAGSSQTFTWSTGAGATKYMFHLGTKGVGSDNLEIQGQTTATSVNVTGIPTYGVTLYARLYSQIGGVWQYTDYTYTEAGTPVAAALSTPTPDSKLTGSSQTFTWSAGGGVTAYMFHLGTKGAGSEDLCLQGQTTATSVNVTGIPTYGVTLYARLYSEIGGVWQYTDYTYTEAGTPVAAALSTPTPGSKLTGSSQTFTWSAGGGVTAYMFHLGTKGAGSEDLCLQGQTTATSVNVTGIPTYGVTLYARLYSYTSGAWEYTDYTYTEAGTPVAAALTGPTPGGTLAGSSQVFSWSAGTGVTAYMFHLGTKGVGSDDLYILGSTTATSSVAVSVPTDGAKLYARLYSRIDGVWQYTDYTYTAQ
jgi:hypothetical protein